jgi:predicted glycogen debranching enzyme
MLHDSNTLIIRYTNKNQGPPLKLILKPILASRDISGLTHENNKINTDSYHDDRVVKISPRPEVPELSIYYLKGDYTQAPLWYYGFKYSDSPDETGRDNGETEDLFNTGFFSCKLDTYESMELYITTDKLINFEYDSIFRKEKEFRQKYRSRLKSSATVVKDISKNVERIHFKSHPGIPLLFPDYPYAHYSTRKLVLSLFGYLLVEKNFPRIKETLKAIISYVDSGLLPANITNPGDGKYSADSTLLLVYFMLYLYKASEDRKFLQETIFEACGDILDKFESNKEHNIYRDSDGLLYAGHKDLSLSWIPKNATKAGEVRYGKLLELNCLYYNALKSMEFFCRELRRNKSAKKYAELAGRTRKSFLVQFWDESNVCFSDLIRGDYRDNAFRINQLFLIALPFSVLDETNGINILKQVESELLTPFGLRSLSFRDPQYVGRLHKIISDRNPDYYNGTVWPWTIRLYIAAVLKYRGRNEQVIDYLKRLLDNFKSVFYYNSIGFLPELFEGNPPHRRNGAVASSLTMNEYLLAQYYLRDL